MSESRLGILLSGRGSNFLAIAESVNQGRISVRPSFCFRHYDYLARRLDISSLNIEFYIVHQFPSFESWLMIRPLATERSSHTVFQVSLSI